jgi:hypothetical protein
MNTCIKCGCDDAYPSLPPCPSPTACPNPPECAEVFPAECVVISLADITCGTDVVVFQGDSIVTAIENIVAYFCQRLVTLIEYIDTTFIQSVTGLNTDNTDPQNPIIRISVDGTTITGLGTPASPLIAAGGTVDGSGTLNYIAKWTPDGTTLGNSLMRDDGTTTSINGAPTAAYKFIVYSSSPTENYALSGNTTNNGAVGTNGISSGIGTATNYGVAGSAQQSTLLNIGSSGLATGPGSVGIGGRFKSILHTDDYSVQLQDGTEGIGKVLTCITADGKANWVTPSGGIAGSGTNNYIARWTPDGTTLGTGLIRDNGSNVGINAVPTANFTFRAVSNTDAYAITGINNNTTTESTGVYGVANGISLSINYGSLMQASGSTTLNIGSKAEAIQATAGTNIGLYGVALLGSSNYAAQFSDGTQGIGKVLTCVTADGKANWNKVTDTYTTGATGIFIVGAQTITVTNGLITSIV